MGFLRYFLFWELLKRSDPKEKATRNREGQPACGGCQTIVDEDATRCPACGARLFTRRGTVARRLTGFFGGTWALGGLISLSGDMYGPAAGAVLLSLGGVLLYVYWQLRQDRPNRELRLSERLPVIGDEATSHAGGATYQENPQTSNHHDHQPDEPHQNQQPDGNTQQRVQSGHQPKDSSNPENVEHSDDRR